MKKGLKTSVEMMGPDVEESQPETEINRRNIINGKDLLCAVSQGNLDEVNRLISEETDISCVDEEGNTVLHRAVLNPNAEIVQTILNDEKVGEIIYVVNENGTTALGIARQSNKENIVEKIEEKILDDSFKILKSLMGKVTTFPIKLTTNSVGESNSQVEPNTKDKIKKKVEICLQTLKELTKSENDIKRFTYKSANVFLFFVETFALEDLKQEQDEKATFINDYIGKEDSDHVKSIRNNLIHRKGEVIIDPTYLQNIVVKSQTEDLKNFFRSLQEYTQAVYDKCNKGQSDSNQINLTEILKSNSNPQEKGKTKKQVLELFRSLVMEAYTNEQNPEKTEEILFNLIVNIIPLIGDDLEIKVREVKDLRDDLIHNFHQYKNLNSRMLKIKETIFNVRSKAFHYYSSGEIHNMLSEIRLDEDYNSIGPNLDRQLLAFKKEFQQNEDDENTFEYVLSQPLFQQEDQAIKKSVGEYLKFMIIIDDEKREEENQVDDEERSKTSEQYKELNDAERREIFEDFIRLEKLQTFSDNTDEIKQRQVELKRKLGAFGIREGQFDEVIKLYIEAKNVPDEEVVNKVVNIIKCLKSLKNAKQLAGYQISSQDIVSLYERFTATTGVFCLDNHNDLLKNYGLIESAKELIKKNLNLLPSNEILDILIGDKNIQINIFKVANNILRTFYNAYHKYQTKFNDIKELFKNEIFLDYLVSLDIRKARSDGQENFEFKDEKHIFIIIKKLIKLEYTAPYIASLLTKVGSDEVIEKDDYIKLIEILLNENSYITYLNEFLYVNSKKIPNSKLYEIVYDKILKTDNFNIESMRAILDDPKHKHAKEILKVLGKKIDSEDSISNELLELTKKVLKLLNNIALKLIYKGKYEEALERLSVKEVELIYKKLNNKKLIKSDDSIIIERKLNIAKAKAAEERKYYKQEKLKEALKVLEEIPDTNFPLFLLASSRKAYIYCLLKQYNKSYEEYDTIYKKIVKWADVDTTSNTKGIYTEIKKSKKYQDLLASSNECKRYLNIVTIKKGFAYNKYMQGNEEKTTEHYKEALKYYNEVYNMNKEDSEKENENHLPILARIAYTHFSIGKVLFKSEKYLDALEHYYTQLAVHNRSLECTRKIYGDYYQNTKTAIKHIINTIQNIAFVDTELGSLQTVENNRARKYYEEALKINEQIYQFQRSNIPEEDECVAQKLRYIACIHYKLTSSYFKSSSNLQKALIHCNKMIETNKEIIRIQTNLLEENDKLLRKTQRHLERAKRIRILIFKKIFKE